MKTKKNSIKERLFLVNTIGIIFNPKSRRILIGKRGKDKYVPKLRWSFPGGVPFLGKDIESSLELKMKEKTGLKVKSLGAVFARIPKEKKNLILIYYLCEVIGGKENPGKDILELKWVKPQELKKYFTTSIDPRLEEYIMSLK